MKTERKTGEILSGKNRENIPDIAFHLMAATMKLMDVFVKHSDKNFKTLDLKPGQTVIDYGCGPARYIKNASEAVGKKGKVFAVDIHPIAVEKVRAKIKKYNLTNVEAVHADGYSTPLDSGIADVVYALDMFHMIEKPTPFLEELARLLKLEGTLIIEDGHQPRAESIGKINAAGFLKIVGENKYHLRCQKEKPSAEE